MLLLLLTGSMFLTVTSANMLTPLLVELAGEFHTSVGAMGQLSAAAAVPWALLAPLMGALSDRFGRRPLLAFAVGTLGVATFLSAMAWDYGSMLVIRVIGGIGGAGTGPNIMSSAADHFPPNRRGTALGAVMGAVSLATVIGVPAVAVVVVFVGWRAAFAMMGLLLMATAIVIYTCFPRSKPGAVYDSGYLTQFRSALQEPPIRLLLLANALERAAFTTGSTYLAAFLIQSYSLGLEQVAPALSATAAGTILGSLLGGKLADRGKRPTLVYAGFQLVAAAIVLPLFATTPGVVATILMATSFGLASSLARPSWMWMVSQVPESRRGATMGFTATTNQVGLMIGAAVGGLLLALWGYAALGVQACCTSLAAAACCAVAARMKGRAG